MIHIHPVEQIWADKARPALCCSDLAGLTLSPVLGWPSATQPPVMKLGVTSVTAATGKLPDDGSTPSPHFCIACAPTFFYFGA